MGDKSQDNIRQAGAAEAIAAAPSDVQTIARRKAILKALGKTAALAGAASPLSTLAATRLRYDRDGKSFQCSVSGNGSALHSASTASVPLCSARPLTEYQSKMTNGARDPANTTAANWPAWPSRVISSVSTAVVYTGSGNGGTAYKPNALFSQVFGASDVRKIGEMINNGVPEAHWIVALLNASKFPSTFPHTPEEVLAHYNDAAKRTAALAFYSAYANKV